MTQLSILLSVFVFNKFNFIFILKLETQFLIRCRKIFQFIDLVKKLTS